MDRTSRFPTRSDPIVSLQPTVGVERNAPGVGIAVVCNCWNVPPVEGAPCIPWRVSVGGKIVPIRHLIGQEVGLGGKCSGMGLLVGFLDGLFVGFLGDGLFVGPGATMLSLI